MRLGTEHGQGDPTEGTGRRHCHHTHSLWPRAGYHRRGHCGRRGRPALAAQAVCRDESRGHPQGTRDEIQHQPPDFLAQGGYSVLRPRQGRGHRRLLPDAGGQEGSTLSHQLAGCPGQDRPCRRALLHGELPVQVHADHC